MKDDEGAWVLARGGLGLSGLVLVAAALVGVRLAALPVLTWLIVTTLLVTRRSGRSHGSGRGRCGRATCP